MTSANKILIIEGGPPIAFSIQSFLWKNGWFDTQIIPRTIDLNTIQNLNPSLIISSKEDSNKKLTAAENVASKFADSIIAGQIKVA